MMQTKKHSGGFTIVEALIAISVTTALVIVITSFMMRNMQQSSLAMARQDIIRETQQSLDMAANDVRLSANADTNNRWIDANNPLGSANPYGWTSNSSALILATAAENQSGTIIFADANNYITEKNNLVYFVKNGTLYKRTLASSVANNKAKTSCPASLATANCPKDKEILHNVTQFTVSYLDGQNQSVAPTDARSIQLRAVVNKKVYSQTLSADYTTRMVFRND